MSTNKSTNVRLAFVKGFLKALDAVSPALAGRLGERLFFTAPRVTPGERLRAILTSATPSSVMSGEKRLQVWAWGRGPVVLLAHGWGGLGAQLADFVPPLLARGYRVVTFDAPGHGASAGRLSSMPQFAAALRAVADAHGPIHAIVSHSLGAAGTALALRDGLQVERAVFVGPAAEPAFYARQFARMLNLSGAAFDVLVATSERRLGIRWADLAVPGFAPRLATPLLVIHDRADREVPFAEGQSIVDAWPDAQMVATEGLGHRRILRDPEVIEAAVSFIATAAIRRCNTCDGPIGRHAEAGRCATCALEWSLFVPGNRLIAA